MKGSAQSKDITIPKGIVICYPIINNVVDTDGGIDIGYCQEAEMGIAESSRQVYSARDSSKALAVDKVTKTDYSLPLQVMSVNAVNLAMLFRGTVGSLIQVVGDYGITAMDLTSPAVLDRAQKLGKRGVSITKINYTGGTVDLVKGLVVTAGGSTANILWVEGTTANGSIFVSNLNGAEFIDGVTITDSGTGSATQLGAVTVLDDVVLTDTAGTTRYALDVDYGIDPKSGTVFYLSAGSIAASTALKAHFDYAGLTEITVQAGESGVSEYQVEILPFNDTTENQIETVLWKCSVKADTTIKLITSGEEEILMDMTFTPLTDGPGASSSFPVFRQIIM